MTKQEILAPTYAQNIPRVLGYHQPLTANIEEEKRIVFSSSTLLTWYQGAWKWAWLSNHALKVPSDYYKLYLAQKHYTNMTNTCGDNLAVGKRQQMVPSGPPLSQTPLPPTQKLLQDPMHTGQYYIQYMRVCEQ